MRRSIWTTGIGAAAALCGWLSGATPALACSCAPPNRAATLPLTSDVFVAEAVGAPRTLPSSAGRPAASGHVPAILGGGTLEYELQVIETLKGSAAGRVTVRTASDSASCGSSFAAGRRYLVFARRGTDGLRTGLCDFNVEGDPGQIQAAVAEVRGLLGGSLSE